MLSTRCSQVHISQTNFKSTIETDRQIYWGERTYVMDDLELECCGIKVVQLTCIRGAEEGMEGETMRGIQSADEEEEEICRFRAVESLGMRSVR